jgi:hypothetical protein
MLETSGSLIPRLTARQVVPARPADGAAPVPKSATAAIADEAAVAQPEPAAEATPPDQAAPTTQTAGELTAGTRARVANTDGLGVVFYAAPQPGARRPAGLLEGTTVTIVEVAGNEWARVQSDARQTGWVRAEFLVPTG